MITPVINPKHYNLAIRKDGKIFRVSRDIESYDDKLLPEHSFCLIRFDKPFLGKSRYFDIHGNLRNRFVLLPRITKAIPYSYYEVPF